MVSKKEYEPAICDLILLPQTPFLRKPFLVGHTDQQNPSHLFMTEFIRKKYNSEGNLKNQMYKCIIIPRYIEIMISTNFTDTIEHD